MQRAVIFLLWEDHFSLAGVTRRPELMATNSRHHRKFNRAGEANGCFVGRLQASFVLPLSIVFLLLFCVLVERKSLVEQGWRDLCDHSLWN